MTDPSSAPVSRRTFLRGAGATATALASLSLPIGASG
ncbi:MAG: twin-arginine translocation signal domain-containing protein, partial [Acetobacteraceae bacterium]|nr:twin-arginine translocation signal domain-containing protein [Acetobacteraceae bacterium]